MRFKEFRKKNDIPRILDNYLEGKKIREINKAHCSKDYVYDVSNQFILKISLDKERTKREKKINDYLSSKLPVSQSVVYVEDEKYAYYLKTKLIGKTLISKEYLNNPPRLAKLLAKGIRLFHSVDASDCKFKNNFSQGNTLIHGDFCLPNILACKDEIVGFIDTEGAGLGDPYVDYAWCIWSFEYNLGSKEFTHLLLKELDIKYDQERANKYLEI